MQAMTLERAREFAEAWNQQGELDYIASFFTEDGILHTSVGRGELGNSYFGRDEVRRGAGLFFERFPGGRFENIDVRVSGTLGILEWEFVALDAEGRASSTHGCDILEFRDGLVARKSAYRKVRDA